MIIEAYIDHKKIRIGDEFKVKKNDVNTKWYISYISCDDDGSVNHVVMINQWFSSGSVIVAESNLFKDFEPTGENVKDIYNLAKKLLER